MAFVGFELHCFHRQGLVLRIPELSLFSLFRTGNTGKKAYIQGSTSKGLQRGTATSEWRRNGDGWEGLEVWESGLDQVSESRIIWDCFRC